MCFRQLLILVQRNRLEKPTIVDSHVQEEMNYVRQYFHEHYNESISIDEFAQSRHMSISLFMRNFKKVYGVSPKQYIVNLRMNNAQISQTSAGKHFKINCMLFVQHRFSRLSRVFCQNLAMTNKM